MVVNPESEDVDQHLEVVQLRHEDGAADVRLSASELAPVEGRDSLVTRRIGRVPELDIVFWEVGLPELRRPEYFAILSLGSIGIGREWNLVADRDDRLGHRNLSHGPRFRQVANDRSAW